MSNIELFLTQSKLNEFGDMFGKARICGMVVMTDQMRSWKKNKKISFTVIKDNQLFFVNRKVFLNKNFGLSVRINNYLVSKCDFD